MHREASEQDHRGTTLTYTATVSGQKDVHMLSVRVPQLFKYDLEVTSIDIDMSKYITILYIADNIYVRTDRGIDAIPMRPSMTHGIFTGSDLEQLHLLFYMLVNADHPTRPCYFEYNRYTDCGGGGSTGSRLAVRGGFGRNGFIDALEPKSMTSGVRLDFKLQEMLDIFYVD
ncbi:hypothetical protein RRG08_000800 [Elysia crispata]|uniref:Uncharacterized protein n=1 Tax=Elysia crispata TaxID=231223 RepID=A0AAE0XN26_9GAST|nr:hypothetical protein RRG08_000800 [Elysia crispata]